MIAAKLALSLVTFAGQAVAALVLAHFATGATVALALIGLASTVVSNGAMVVVALMNHRGIRNVGDRVSGVERQVGRASQAARESADELRSWAAPDGRSS